MTLEEQRRAIHDGMVARRGTGAQMTASRQAIGTAMVSRRTGRTTVDELNSLIAPATPKPGLPPVEPRGGVPATRGRGDYTAPAGGSSTAGIASPLTETNYGDREYWAEKTITSSDGLLSFRLRPIKSISQTDANGAPVVQLFANPAPEPAP